MKNFAKNFNDWLQRPYIFEEDKFFQFSLSFIIGLIVFIVIYTFRPFGISSLENDMFLYCAGYGIITFSVLFFLFFVLTPIFSIFFSDNTWNVRKEISTILLCMATIGLLCWYYNSLVQIGGDNPENFTLKSYMKYAFTIGIIPVIVYVFIGEWYLRFTRKRTTEDLKSRKDKKRKKERIKGNDTITIISENKKNQFTFLVSNFVYATSEGNYVSFFTLADNGLSEKVLRTKLSTTEEILKPIKEIIRCHKSYIVNTSFVKDISGNARGYFLHFEETDKEIPVSRKFSREELEKLLPS